MQDADLSLNAHMNLRMGLGFAFRHRQRIRPLVDTNVRQRLCPSCALLSRPQMSLYTPLSTLKTSYTLLVFSVLIHRRSLPLASLGISYRLAVALEKLSTRLAPRCITSGCVILGIRGYRLIHSTAHCTTYRPQRPSSPTS